MFEREDSAFKINLSMFVYVFLRSSMLAYMCVSLCTSALTGYLLKKGTFPRGGRFREVAPTPEAHQVRRGRGRGLRCFLTDYMSKSRNPDLFSFIVSAILSTGHV